MSELRRQSRFERGEQVVVMKFGGTSVEDAAAIRRLIEIVRSRSGSQPVLVVSALAKVTDQLLAAGHAAAAGHLGSALATVRNIYVRHEQLADGLVEGAAYHALERDLRTEIQTLERLLQDLYSSREFRLQVKDHLLGFGECLSSRLVSEVLRQNGIGASHVDAREYIVTDSRHGQAGPLWDITNERLREVLSPLLGQGSVPVLGGFIASSSEGVPTTLGRGGSDFSAAIIGAALGASRIEIWTDVDGVMTTDPRLCPDARVIRKMSFEEAAELAHFGAKVLHPSTLAPAERENIPVYVLNSRRPEETGTEITARARHGQTVSAITAKRNVASVQIESSVGIDAPFLDAVFVAFDKHNCSVDVMATSLGRISMLVGSAEALPAIAADLQGVAELKWENQKALVCLVGENIRRQPEVASLVFGAVADLGARVFCQGPSERTISFLVEENKVEESVQRLHGLFFPKHEPARDWGGISTAFCQAG